MKKITLLLFATLSVVCFLVTSSIIVRPSNAFNDEMDTHLYYNNSNQFRNTVVNFLKDIARNYFDNKSTHNPKELLIEGNWYLYVIIYHQGEIKGYGDGENELLSLALEEATKHALQNKRFKDFSKEDMEDARFLVTFPYYPEQFSFIEYRGEGKELINDLKIIRNLDKEMIRKNIELGKQYLFKVMDKDLYGFHKYYYAISDEFENRLHTVYSASCIFTLLKVFDYDKDEQIMEYVPKCADFLLSMQNKDKRHYGAFHYSYFLDTKEKELKFVVGTASKVIYTLLMFYERAGNTKYLESARKAGNWLITMQKPDGNMYPYSRYRDGKWFRGKKDSTLYNGQVLSALSRLYRITGEKSYYDSAEKIAKYLVRKIQKEGPYLGDEYRKPNPVSTSWSILSLLDFYKASDADNKILTNCDKGEEYKKIVLESCNELLNRQMTETEDPFYHGRWRRAWSTSGNGWINEVLGEVYMFCKEQKIEDHDKYKDAIIKVTRWIMQHTYTEESSFYLKEPEKATGGVFWNYKNKYVRTDSVCHSVNAYVNIINDLDDRTLISIPEKPINEILSVLGKEGKD